MLEIELFTNMIGQNRLHRVVFAVVKTTSCAAWAFYNHQLEIKTNFWLLTHTSVYVYSILQSSWNKDFCFDRPKMPHESRITWGDRIHPISYLSSGSTAFSGVANL